MIHYKTIETIAGDSAEKLLKEYMYTTHPKVCEHYNLDYDVDGMYDSDLHDTTKYQPPRGQFIAAFDGNEPVGMGAFSQLDDQSVEVKRFYVKESYRNRGIATTILKECIDQAQKLGYCFMYLESSRFMTEAHALYRKFGFEETTLYEGACSKPGYEFAIIFMKRAL